LPFKPNDSFFESLSSQDAIVELSGQLKVIAVSLMKIANDLRWMNSALLRARRNRTHCFTTRQQYYAG